MARNVKRIVTGAALAAASVMIASPVVAQDDAPAAEQFPIGFIDLVDDPRFDPEYAYHYIPVRPLGPAVEGAELGIADGAQIGDVIGIEFTLEHQSGQTIEELVAAVEGMVSNGAHFVLTDLPADMLLAVSDAVTDLPVTLMNVSAEENVLRGESCRANIVHAIPSHQMLTDAMVQFLVSNRWTNILALHGPLEEDQAVLESLQRSANSFGANITDVRTVLLSNDPREREEGNMALVTAGARSYDVAYIIDNDGEFARFYAPYQTQAPRPVVGSTGLVPVAWHWSWERSGAPQLNARFEAEFGRRMGGEDWAAWVSIKALVQSALRTQSTDYQAVRDYLLGDQLILDGYHGYPMSVRPWDHQMRQTVLLATGNAVIELAPIEGFAHRINDLDTLGVDEPQSACAF